MTSLNVVRVEAEDDGSFTAVTDHWPRDTKANDILRRMEVLAASIEKDGIAITAPRSARWPSSRQETRR